jgi:hypothetical protein
LLYRLGGEQLVSGDLSIKLFGNSDYGLFIADSRRKKKKQNGYIFHWIRR